ncbi:hypothetical protein RRF57_005978 [Xylaria bambusicola]|uniref:Uncharacterized protein n=1 Tax=Xylaria bambusicola TaxID=326684 RepID=A0AAN7Z8G5_9PEZI
MANWQIAVLLVKPMTTAQIKRYSARAEKQVMTLEMIVTLCRLQKGAAKHTIRFSLSSDLQNTGLIR